MLEANLGKNGIAWCEAVFIGLSGILSIGLVKPVDGPADGFLERPADVTLDELLDVRLNGIWKWYV